MDRILRIIAILSGILFALGGVYGAWDFHYEWLATFASLVFVTTVVVWRGGPRAFSAGFRAGVLFRIWSPLLEALMFSTYRTHNPDLVHRFDVVSIERTLLTGLVAVFVFAFLTGVFSVIVKRARAVPPENEEAATEVRPENR